MLIDLHCHAGYSHWTTARTAALGGADERGRFSFETHGSGGNLGLDSYFSSRVMAKWGLLCRWGIVRRALGVDWRLGPGPELDDQITAFNDRHLLGCRSAQQCVLLAFDEYHTDAGVPLGPPRQSTLGDKWRNLAFGGLVSDGANQPERLRGSDLYVSNSLALALSRREPDRLLFGASLHPYRSHNGRSAAELLPELQQAGAVLIKWLPLHMNINAADPRTVDFIRAAHRVGLPLLIHYGGEMTLALQHPEFIDPAPLLDVLRALRQEGCMPVVVVAHAATPSHRLQSSASCESFLSALGGEFRDAPLYADISGMAGPGRAPWLLRLARRRGLHDKLVWATDFPIPPVVEVFAPWLGWRDSMRIRRIPSWIDRDIELKRALGFDSGIFTRGAEIVQAAQRRQPPTQTAPA